MSKSVVVDGAAPENVQQRNQLVKFRLKIHLRFTRRTPLEMHEISTVNARMERFTCKKILKKSSRKNHTEARVNSQK